MTRLLPLVSRAGRVLLQSNPPRSCWLNLIAVDRRSYVTKNKYTPSKPPAPVIYNRGEGRETIENYTEDGYYPVHLGNRFHNDRYEVVDKLAFSKHFTSWLAADHTDQTYVALNISTALAGTRGIEYFSFMNDPANDPTDDPVGFQRGDKTKRTFIPSLLDNFEIQGDLGTHQCWVTEPAGQSLYKLRKMSRKLFNLDVARVIIVQLMQAVAAIHARGAVHGGLHLANVKFHIQDQKQISHRKPSDYHKDFDESRLVLIRRNNNFQETPPPGIPEYTVNPIRLGRGFCDSITLAESQIFLDNTDYTFSSTSPGIRKQGRVRVFLPPLYAPEFHFPRMDIKTRQRYTAPFDIWNLAILMFQVMGSQPLFHFNNFYGRTTMYWRDEMVKEYVEALGIDTMPEDWWEDWPVRDQWFYYDGKLRRQHFQLPQNTLEARMQHAIQEPRRMKRVKTLNMNELTAFTNLLRDMLSIDPEGRMPVEEALRSEWVVRFAMPVLKRAERVWEKGGDDWEWF
ncbi:kinase-like domain-containing protein [Aspergillus karnatakaensis]|uniref:kinase-like domain-containing protein n=1 Tax=Aspergillus karnatakaensis TaxID=1810916 RepID=UPI003CCE3A10